MTDSPSPTDGPDHPDDDQSVDNHPDVDQLEHISVMPSEVMQLLKLSEGDTAFDGTMGAGGHTALMLKKIEPSGQVIACDRDPASIEHATQRFAKRPISVYQGSYAELPSVLKELELPGVDGILLDLGLSSDQLADDTRGFSYHATGPLDLRFDTSRGQPAWEWMQYRKEEELAKVIYEYGEERFSRRIARNIKAVQKKGEAIRTADQLSDLIRRCVPRSKGHNIDPATRTFQALRIAVNGELNELKSILTNLPEILNPGGRVVIISFHSLEDRIVKNAFRESESLETLTRKPIRPSEAEVAQNPRSRSAKVRAARRTPVS